MPTNTLCLQPDNFWFIVWLTLEPEDGCSIFFRNVNTHTGLHGVKTDKTMLFIATVKSTSNATAHIQGILETSL